MNESRRGLILSFSYRAECRSMTQEFVYARDFFTPPVHPRKKSAHLIMPSFHSRLLALCSTGFHIGGRGEAHRKIFFPRV